MDRMDRWPYEDRPVVINNNPHSYRPRLASEHVIPAPVYYAGPQGQLLVPAGSVHRSSSTSSRHYRQAEYRAPEYRQPAPEYRQPAPAPVTIVNENITYDDHHGEREHERERRPRSQHGRHHSSHYYREEEYSDRSRSRSRSRVRIRTPSPYYEQRLLEQRLAETRLAETKLAETRLESKVESEVEIRARLKRLDDLERKEREEREKRRIQEELVLEQAKREAEAARKKKEEDEFRKRAIEEYNHKQEEEREKKKKEEEKAAKELREKMWRTLHNNGYSDAEIEDILKKGEKEKKHGKAHDHVPHVIREVEAESSSMVVSLARPTYIKVNKKHLDPYTLDVYELPWEYDERDSNYIIIKQWIPEHDQEILFEHTRKHREQKTIMHTTTELRKEHDQLVLVRKRDKRGKSPAVAIKVLR